jgi:ketosteroid isomerase-like protein
MRIQALFTIMIFLIITAGYNIGSYIGEEEKKLLDIDREFSQLLKKRGPEQAILSYLSDNAIILPLKSHPVHGKTSILKLIKKNRLAINKKRLLWEPIFMAVSESQDFGYTYGQYEPSQNNTTGHKTGQLNYYLTIWRKGLDSEWKIIFNIGLIDEANSREDSISVLQVKRFNSLEKELITTDSEFSNMSFKKGSLKAFYYFISDEGICFSDERSPPAGKETLRELLDKRKDEKGSNNAQLSWKPLFASVSSAGDLGYTLGKHTSILFKTPDKKAIRTGYYLTIWKKQPDGTWRFVFDIGNQLPSQ